MLKIIYCGQDLTSLKLLNESSQVDLLGVADITAFSNSPCINWADRLFKLLYKFKKKNHYLAFPLKWFQKKSEPFCSFSFRKSTPLLQLICSDHLKIIDIEDLQTYSSFCETHEIDLLLVNNWSMLPGAILDIPKLGTINIHPSKLPAYRGSLPTLWSLKNRDLSSAVSFIKLNQGMDSGDLLKQIEFDIEEQDDAISIEKKIEDILKNHLIQILCQFANNETDCIAQDNSKASYTDKYFPYMKIYWFDESEQEILNKINLYPYLWPFDFCFSLVDGKKIKFRSAQHLSSAPSHITLNTVGDYQLDFEHFYIKVKSGIIKAQIHTDWTLDGVVE